MKKLWILLTLLLGGIILISGCRKAPEIHYAMLGDSPQLTENSYTYGMYEGLKTFERSNPDTAVSYLESQSPEDYLANAEKLADDGNTLIWGMGGTTEDALLTSAGYNPDIRYIILDASDTQTVLPQNVNTIVFASEQAAFLAGYAAGTATQSNHVGFIGGMKIPAVERFEYGYRYGVEIAAKELEKNIQCDVLYTDSFSEAALGQKKATQLYQSGCDVLFPVAGTTGTGVIEAAITADKWVIGVDIDQYENAPRVILTSVVKRTTNVVKYFTQRFHDGNLEGGTVIVRGLKEDAVGIPKENPNIDAHFPQLTERLDALSLEIKNGQRPIPATQGQYQSLSDAS